MTAFFVVGTDTGVGKTTAAGALLAAAAARGLRAGCLKPAESGCERSGSGLVPADAIFLARAAGYEAPVEELCPYRFEAAVAPGVAAEEAGQEIDLAVIRRALERALARKPELLLVEGAGGLLVPFGGGRLLADVAVALGLPLLVVGRAGLGTINHTLLTVESAVRRGLRVSGVLLCETEPEPASFVASNVREIEAAIEVPVLGVVPFLEEMSVERLARAGEECGALDVLLGGS